MVIDRAEAQGEKRGNPRSVKLGTCIIAHFAANYHVLVEEFPSMEDIEATVRIIGNYGLILGTI